MMRCRTCYMALFKEYSLVYPFTSAGKCSFECSPELVAPKTRNVPHSSTKGQGIS